MVTHLHTHTHTNAHSADENLIFEMSLTSQLEPLKEGAGQLLVVAPLSDNRHAPPSVNHPPRQAPVSPPIPIN